MDESKPFWKSKTFWVNILAGGAMLVQQVTGSFIVSPEEQGAFIVLANLILRAVTKGAITLT